jgi:hypothetical protein
MCINALHNAECHHAECRVLFITTLRADMLNVVMVIVITLSVVAPYCVLRKVRTNVVRSVFVQGCLNVREVANF